MRERVRGLSARIRDRRWGPQMVTKTAITLNQIIAFIGIELLSKASKQSVRPDEETCPSRYHRLHCAYDGHASQPVLCRTNPFSSDKEIELGACMQSSGQHSRRHCLRRTLYWSNRTPGRFEGLWCSHAVDVLVEGGSHRRCR